MLTQFQEDKAPEIELFDDDTAAVKAMLRFLYDQPYAADEATWHDGISLMPHLHVYVVAEKYDLQNLKRAAFENIGSILGNDNESVDLYEALRVAFTLTPTGDQMVRTLFTDSCGTRLPRLIKQPDFIKVLDEVAELGSAIVQKMGARHPRKAGKEMEVVMCPRCDRLQNPLYAASTGADHCMWSGCGQFILYPSNRRTFVEKT